eukprot:COSAG02_NODE_60801_length_269_cov_0.725146_1_plen_76_part_10
MDRDQVAPTAVPWGGGNRGLRTGELGHAMSLTRASRGGRSTHPRAALSNRRLETPNYHSMNRQKIPNHHSNCHCAN